MSERQLKQLVDRVSKLEAEVEQLKSGTRCGDGLLGLFGSQKDNPFFLEVLAEIEKDRETEKSLMAVTPAKKRVSRRVATAKRKSVR